MVAETKFYKTLEVNPDASPAQLKAAYPKLALKFHPDKSSSSPETAAEKFKELKHAHDILSNPQKRKYHDILSENGIKQERTYAEHIFSQSFHRQDFWDETQRYER